MTAHLVDVRRTLTLFAEGICGHHVEFDSEQRAGSNAVVLPPSLNWFEDAVLDRRAYRLEVLRALVDRVDGVATFDFTVALNLFADLLPPARSAMRFRLGGTPVERFSRMTLDPELVIVTFHLLDTLRVSALLRRRFPGVEADVVRDGLRRAAELRQSGNWVSGAVLAPLFDLVGPTARPPRSTIEVFASGVLDPGASVYRAMEGALHIARIIADEFGFGGAAGSVAVDPEGSASASDHDDGSEPESGPVEPESDGSVPFESDREAIAFASADSLDGGGTAFILDLADDEFLNAPAGGGELVVDAPAHQWKSSPLDESTGLKVPERRAGVAAAPLRDGDRSYRYAEWDYTCSAYLPEWCRLVERRVPPGPVGYLDELHREHSKISAQIKRRFSMIAPELLMRVHDTDDGDALSIDALIGYSVDRRAGIASEAPLYIRRDRADRDVAAAFLIDLSRSTETPVGPPPHIDGGPGASDAGQTQAAHDQQNADRYDPFGPGYWDIPEVEAAPLGRRVIDVARDAVALLCEPLDSLGDRHAIYGFSGRGRHQVDFMVAKEFEERATSKTWASLGSMEPMGYTRMGPAVRHAAYKLSRQGARTRILVMISDGYPQDEGYGPTPGDRDYGIHDTAQALREAEAVGITTFCLTVDPAGHDYLRRMCPEQRYLVIDDIDSLATELEKIYSTLTGRDRRPLR
jgi:hypothetical protein